MPKSLAFLSPYIYTPTSPLLQVMVVCRVVTPQEYDEATLRRPHCCPLWLMGDHRSGQQLIDSAAEDFQQTMASLACSPEGRARLEGIAGHLEQQLQAIDLALSCGR